MFRLLPLFVLVLSGCGILPSPEHAVAKGNAQIRLSVVQGNVEGFTAGGTGTSCIATFLGPTPKKVRGTLKLGDCEIGWKGK